MSGFQFFLFISFLSFAVFGCGEPPSEPHDKRPSPTPPAEASRSETARPTGRRPAPPPMEAPRAYFGALKARRLETPLTIETMEGGQSVVLVVMDALNVHHLGLYGYQRDTSPTIDALAEDGVFFTGHVSNSSWTRPSFTTIITGLPKSEHGVELGAKVVETELTTIAERFLAAGYRTAGFVGNPLVREIWGYGQGYQVYGDTKSFDKAFPWDGRLVDEALKWLKTVGDKPFFLTLFLTAPHVPYRPPRQARRFLSSVARGHVIEYPFREYEQPLKKDEHDRIVAAYDDEIAYMDREIGRLVAYLKKSGAFERTALLFTADHGEVFGDHNCYTHTYHMWEPALRVPLVIRAPKMSARGVYDDRPSTHVDMAPTLLDLAGVPKHRADLKGESVVEVLRDPRAGRQRVLFSQYNAHGIRRQAIRDDRYKVVHYHRIESSALSCLNNLRDNIPTAKPEDLPSLKASLKGERYALFDLTADPKEEKDLFGELEKKPEVQALLKELLTYLKEKAELGAMSQELIEALRNAGYFIPEESEAGAKEKEK
jgi:arylsulfatase A-like enzyme